MTLPKAISIFSNILYLDQPGGVGTMDLPSENVNLSLREPSGPDASEFSI